jgi:hypothetical protein
MAKRKSGARKRTTKKGKKTKRAARSAKRPRKGRRASRTKRASRAKRASSAKRAARVKRASRAKRAPRAKKAAVARKSPKRARKSPAKIEMARSAPARLGRERRTLDDLIPTPPSSLDMDRRGSAARTGRAEMAESRANQASLTPDISAGDVDVNVEDAYFVGDESPGGDNPTPDQDVVDEIGKALGVEYQDAEELRGSEKVSDRDKHRWELDPASSEDYKSRK